MVSQVDELQLIIHEIMAEGYKICEGFQVSAIIEKLPPSWKEYKNGLKHKHKEMSLADLTMRIRIEEDNRNSEQKQKTAELNSKANLVEGKPRNFHKPSISGSKHGGHKSHDQKHKSSSKKVYEQNSNSKTQFKTKPLASRACFVCGITGHVAKDCKHRKANPVKNQANVTEEGNFSVVVTKVNLVSNKTD